MTAAKPIRDALNLRERLFISEYLLRKCSNGKEAAIAAGYKGDVAKRAHLLLQRPHIRSVVEVEKQRLLQRLEVKKEKVLTEMARVAFLDPRHLVNEDGSLKQLNEIDPNTAAAIAGIDYKAGGVVRIRFVSKLGALDLLGRFLNLWAGSGDSVGDRLDEILEAFKAGPVGPKKESIQ